MKRMTSHAFEKLPLPRKVQAQSSSGKYRVYSDATNFKQVDAASALEALQASGLKEAYRIERDSINNKVTIETLAEEKPAEAAKPAQTAAPAASAPAEQTVAAPAAAAAPAAPPEAKPATPQAPLSKDDVNKLLDGKS